MRLQVEINLKEGSKTQVSTEETPALLNVSNPVKLHNNVVEGFKGFQLSANYENVASTLDGSYKFFPST